MSKFLVRLSFIFSLQLYLVFGAQTNSSAELSPYYHRFFLDGIPLYYWSPDKGENFGDYLSFKLIERIINGPVSYFGKNPSNDYRTKLLAIGSILHFANDHDVIWGSGINGKHLNKEDYHFKQLDVRAVRGPLTRQFLIDNFSIDCPEIYGEPGLLFPYLFPEFKRQENPSNPYLIIPHSSEEHLYLISSNVIYPTEPWDAVIRKILDSQLVISSSLHGIVIAEAWGIPARLLKVTNNEPLFKYEDYYLGSGRTHFQYATSVEQALEMGGEPPIKCNLKKLYEAFPFDFWNNVDFRDSDILNLPTHDCMDISRGV